MSHASTQDIFLPTTEQILMAQERAILAALDVTLLLAERALRAEHVCLGDDSEPSPPHLAIAGSIVLLAQSLRELIASYQLATESALGDG